MRALLAASIALVAGCDARVLYTVEGTVTGGGDPLDGIRVECALADDADATSQAVTDDAGGYACTAVLDAVPGAPRDARAIAVSFVDEDGEQNGAWERQTTEVVVDPDATEGLDVDLDPA